MENIEDTLKERGKTHGNYETQAILGQRIKRAMRNGKNWFGLHDDQIDALEMITVKVSRILTGNPNELDHLLDIVGYATLVANRLKGDSK